MQETCAYCGQPLRLVAGFCATCRAPALVASRRRLVASSRRPDAIPAPVLVAHLSAQRDVLKPRATAWSRLMLFGGLASLAVALCCIFLTVNHADSAAVIAPQSALVTSATASGPNATSFTAGQVIYLRYGAQISQSWADVTLTIAPAHEPARALTERWFAGTSQRAEPLVALEPGAWTITLQVNGTLLRSATITIAPA